MAEQLVSGGGVASCAGGGSAGGNPLVNLADSVLDRARVRPLVADSEAPSPYR